MPEKHPFIVEPYEDDPDAVIPEAVLEPHPVDKRTIAQQLKDNLSVKVTPTEASFKDHFEF